MLDVEQRKYLIERIKQAYNEVKAALTVQHNKKTTKEYEPTTEEINKILKTNNTKRYFLNQAPYGFSKDTWLIKFLPEVTPWQGIEKDYTKIISELNAEKNAVLDKIMLGGDIEAAKVLEDFLKIIKEAKEAINVN